MSIVFLNSNQAKSGFLNGARLPEAYVLLCKFLGCGAIDRTQSLDQGFDYSVLDPLPRLRASTQQFDEISDARAADLLERSMRTSKPLRVFWSGGIDSTAALIALIKVGAQRNRSDLIRVVLTVESIQEYVDFYRRQILGRYRVEAAARPLSAALTPDAINVTGGHGDQLYGSHLLRRYLPGGSACLSFGDMLPLVLTDRLGSVRDADLVMRYLEPQIAAAPVPITTLFECMWWLEYSLRWQQIALRMQAFFAGNVPAVQPSVEHFYRTEAFQGWSMAQPGIHTAAAWTCYKQPTKEYIFRFTNDFAYYRFKCKELSMKRVIVTRRQRQEYRAHVMMQEDYVPVVQLVQRD